MIVLSCFDPRVHPGRLIFFAICTIGVSQKEMNLMPSLLIPFAALILAIIFGLIDLLIQTA